ncbi:hypothetical protein BDN67DRAFT_971883 [Paxillus ammoniavirescens]|nr:hypothetical protein BDN67DRAFT_971883 [Paxillus ammoniavirescens]
MKAFLTLLVAITSLSAHTLVGVHAKCAACPTTLKNNAVFVTQCAQKGAVKCL